MINMKKCGLFILIQMLVVLCLIGCGKATDDGESKEGKKDAILPFSTANWESTVDDIETIEGKKADEEYEADTGGKAYAFNDKTFEGHNGCIRYFTDSKGLLTMARFEILYDKSEDLENDYNKYVNNFNEKYGEAGYISEDSKMVSGKVWYTKEKNVGLISSEVVGTNTLMIIYSKPSDDNQTSNNNNDETQNKVTTGSSEEDGNGLSFDFEKMNLKETVSNEFMQVTFDKLTYSKELNPSDTSESYYRYYEEESGKKYFYLDGTLKLLSGYSCNPSNTVAKIIFDNKYNYDAIVFTETNNQISDFYSIEPMTSCRIIIMALVPDEVINSYKTVDIQWGMTNDFGSTSSDKYRPVSNWDDCTMGYEMKAE